MDMYQKRRQRQNKKEEQGVEQNQSKTNINWDNPTKGQPPSNSYNISI